MHACFAWSHRCLFSCVHVHAETSACIVSHMLVFFSSPSYSFIWESFQQPCFLASSWRKGEPCFLSFLEKKCLHFRTRVFFVWWYHTLIVLSLLVVNKMYPNALCVCFPVPLLSTCPIASAPHTKLRTYIHKYIHTYIHNRDILTLGNHSDIVFRCGNFGMLVLAAIDKTKVDVKSKCCNCVCACVYVWQVLELYTYIHTYIHTYRSSAANGRGNCCTWTHTYTYIHTYIYTYIHTGVLQLMAGTTAARGGQSGGLVTVFSNGSTMRERYVPFKRADVSTVYHVYIYIYIYIYIQYLCVYVNTWMRNKIHDIHICILWHVYIYHICILWHVYIYHICIWHDIHTFIWRQALYIFHHQHNHQDNLQLFHT